LLEEFLPRCLRLKPKREMALTERVIMHITINRDLDPDGSKLRALLEAQYTYERMSAARSFLVHLLAMASMPVWLGASWPALLLAQVRAFALALWVGLFFIAILVGVQEWTWHRRLARYLSEYQARQRGDTG
jgi:hypothetical protein